MFKTTQTYLFSVDQESRLSSLLRVLPEIKVSARMGSPLRFGLPFHAHSGHWQNLFSFWLSAVKGYPQFPVLWLSHNLTISSKSVGKSHLKTHLIRSGPPRIVSLLTNSKGIKSHLQTLSLLSYNII